MKSLGDKSSDGSISFRFTKSAAGSRIGLGKLPKYAHAVRCRTKGSTHGKLRNRSYVNRSCGIELGQVRWKFNSSLQVKVSRLPYAVIPPCPFHFVPYLWTDEMLCSVCKRCTRWLYPCGTNLLNVGRPYIQKRALGGHLAATSSRRASHRLASLQTSLYVAFLAQKLFSVPSVSSVVNKLSLPLRPPSVAKSNPPR